MYDILEYPDRAEYLKRFSTYDVDLAHWKELAGSFGRSFQEVYQRRCSAVLLVHGGQGTGKSMFSLRLQEDFQQAKGGGGRKPDEGNLWHTLVGGDPPTKERIERATQDTVLRKIDPTNKWLDGARTFAQNDTSRVRIFVLDDAHKDVFMCEWASISRDAYLDLKARGAEMVVLGSVAQKLVEDCRGDFQSSIFVMLSNNSAQMQGLKDEIDRSHRGLAKVLELPLPAPEVKEKIIRKNTNRLNPLSYWCCLDAGGGKERMKVSEVLLAKDKGFIDSFEAVKEALGSGEAKRAGRPANRNLITLVTLGTPPSTVKNFLDDVEMTHAEDFRGDHLGVWRMREQWASTQYRGDDKEVARRVRMMESEFVLRWVALDMRATALLCAGAVGDPIVEKLVEVVRFFPSIGKPEEVKRHGTDCKVLDEGVGVSVVDVAAFEEEFVAMGQQRSLIYEVALRRHFARYGCGVAVFSSLRPDVIVGEYKPCAITAAKDKITAAKDKEEAIAEAIRREGHTIEFTAHLQEDMKGLVEYLLDKVDRYARMLESV